MAEINEVDFDFLVDITVAKQWISGRVNYETSSYGLSYNV
jgi:hypothetical protein